jgi:hypothetical protein
MEAQRPIPWRKAAGAASARPVLVEREPMLKQMAKFALVASVLTLVACGGGTSPFTNRFGGGTGKLVVLVGDQPVCDVSSFRMTVTGVALVPQSGGSSVSVLSSAQPVTIDLASLMDVSALLSLNNVPAGTYSQITFTLANPQLTLVDYTQNPPAPATLAVTLPSLTVTYDVNPALTVTANGTAGLQIDFDLRNSIVTDTQGNVTGDANLVASVKPLSPVAGTGFGVIENLHGLVQSVSTTASGSFTGSVVVQTTGLAGTNRTVNLTSSTVLNGLTSDLASLLPQTFVEINAYVDSSGNIVATRLTAEEIDQEALQHAGFLGQITSVTRLASGDISEFTMIVQEEYPDVSAAVPLQASAQVVVLPSAVFYVAAPEDNTAQLALGPATVGIGQEVTVHGNYLAGQRGVPAVVNATSIYLREQTVEGNFSSLLAAGQDGKTGGFKFTPCSGVFQGQTISVLTFSGTEFENVTDLNSLTTTPTLLVHGELFYEPTLASSGTVTLTPPSNVLVSGKVHQLP